MHPADAQRDRDEADDRGEARQPDADGTGGRSQEEENTARRDNAAIRRGFELDQRRATPRPTRAATGAAIAVARTADATRRRGDTGADHATGHGERSPAKARTAAAAPLRAR